jgi:TetR/AcrR family transcriptional repressor of nem operon
MGIGRGSFYDTFGDKHALFLAALDRFREARTSWIDTVLEGAGLERIEEVFRRSTGS